MSWRDLSSVTIKCATMVATVVVPAIGQLVSSIILHVVGTSSTYLSFLWKPLRMRVFLLGLRARRGEVAFKDCHSHKLNNSHPPIWTANIILIP